jgi:hypothetical protein
MRQAVLAAVITAVGLMTVILPPAPVVGGTPTSIVVTIENTGPSSFTDVFLGFDIPPIDPGQTIDAWIGNPFSSSNIGNFRYHGLPVSTSNPLPPGATACTDPLSALVAGTTLEFDYVTEFGNGFSDVVNQGFPEIVVDSTALPFDFAHAGVTGGRLAGVVRFLSTAPDGCSASDVALLAPVPKGISLTVLHGYNDPPYASPPTQPCNITSGTRPGSQLDHCRNQQFGLDLRPSAGWDGTILAPAPGTPSARGPVPGAGGPCLNFKLDDGTNLNICHFTSVSAVPGQHVQRGAVLGRASTPWIHLSLDKRPATDCTGGWRLLPGQPASYYCPVQFVAPYTLEGHSLPWDGSAKQRQFDDVFPLTSTNGG